MFKPEDVEEQVSICQAQDRSSFHFRLRVQQYFLSSAEVTLMGAGEELYIRERGRVNECILSFVHHRAHGSWRLGKVFFLYDTQIILDMLRFLDLIILLPAANCAVGLLAQTPSPGTDGQNLRRSK